MNRVFSIVVLSAVLTALAFGQLEPLPKTGRHGAAREAASSERDRSSPAPHPLYEHNLNFYEFVLHLMNPHDFDWGSWLGEQREAIRDACLYNRFFWLAFWATLGYLVAVIGWANCSWDRKREKRIMGAQMDEVREYADYSVQVAKEAIRQYNAHIELCNRVIESEEGGLGNAGGGNADLPAELDRARQQIGLLEGDKRRLEEEVAQKTTVITDLSLRVDALSTQLGDNGHGAAPHDVSPSSHPELVRQINSLQQQLCAERDKNKRLKGGA